MDQLHGFTFFPLFHMFSAAKAAATADDAIGCPGRPSVSTLAHSLLFCADELSKMIEDSNPVLRRSMLDHLRRGPPFVRLTSPSLDRYTDTALLRARLVLPYLSCPCIECVRLRSDVVKLSRPSEASRYAVARLVCEVDAKTIDDLFVEIAAGALGSCWFSRNRRHALAPIVGDMNGPRRLRHGSTADDLLAMRGLAEANARPRLHHLIKYAGSEGRFMVKIEGEIDDDKDGQVNHDNNKTDEDEDDEGEGDKDNCNTVLISDPTANLEATVMTDTPGTAVPYPPPNRFPRGRMTTTETTTTTRHYPLNDLNVPLGCYSHRRLGLADILVQQIMALYMSTSPVILSFQYSVNEPAQSAPVRRCNQVRLKHFTRRQCREQSEVSPFFTLWVVAPDFAHKLETLERMLYTRSDILAWPRHGYHGSLLADRPASPQDDPLTIGDRVLDLVQRYYLEVRDPWTRDWFEATANTKRMLKGHVHGGHPEWWDNVEAAVDGKPIRNHMDLLRSTAVRGREVHRACHVFSGFAARPPRNPSPETLQRILHRTPAPDTFLCYSYRPSISTILGPMTGHLHRPPPPRDRPAHRETRGRRRSRSCPAPGGFTTTLCDPLATLTSNLFYRRLPLRELDRLSRRRSLSRRAILDMVWSEKYSIPEINHSLVSAWDPKTATRSPNTDSFGLKDGLKDGPPYDLHQCGFCGELDHRSDSCQMPAAERCKCRPFPQMHRAKKCPVLCTRDCGSPYVPGHHMHANAMTCKTRCCMCGLPGHSGRECKQQKCRCSKQHLGQDCRWKPMCFPPCKRFVCGIHCRECGANKNIQGSLCAVCLNKYGYSAQGNKETNEQVGNNNSNNNNSSSSNERPVKRRGRRAGRKHKRRGEPQKEESADTTCDGDPKDDPNGDLNDGNDQKVADEGPGTDEGPNGWSIFKEPILKRIVQEEYRRK